MFLKNTTNMFTNKSKGSSLSIITQGIDFTGEVNTEGDIHLDGNMKGTIKANEVVIGPNGSFEGEIISNILIVSGDVKGKFNIKNLHVRKDGTLSGKAKYFIVTIESGGKVLGELGLTKAPKVVTSSANKNSNTKANNTSSSTSSEDT
ncbi:MAG: polymer-forming cytoskeletal protein [Pseudomonadota bacterium]|jgi:cytoskeletal protein CcmA (bactofilin family)|nr:polymer-forming cytoskeletal protein [Pseudomonadota bacterium]